MSRMRFASGAGGGGGGGRDDFDSARLHNRNGNGAGFDDASNLARCPCETPQRSVFTVSHLLIAHSEDWERLMAWLPLADGDVHANPGRYFEEFWPSWTQDCELRQIEGPKNDHGFAFEISAPGFPIRVRGNNKQIRQAQATAVLHFMLALVSGRHDISGLPPAVQERLATLPAQRPSLPDWLSIDIRDMRVKDEDQEYTQQAICRQYSTFTTRLSEMELDPTDHYASPRKILDELEIECPYFTYRKLRSGLWRAYAIHRQLTVCGDATYVADARAAAVMHLVVLAMRGIVASNWSANVKYESCSRPRNSTQNGNQAREQYDVRPLQPPHHRPNRSRSRSRSPVRHSRFAPGTNQNEASRYGRNRGRSRSRSPPVKSARHERRSQSPWARRRRSASRSRSPPRMHPRDRDRNERGGHELDRKRSMERRRSTSPESKPRRRKSPSPDSSSRRRSTTEPTKPVRSVAATPAASGASDQRLPQVPTPIDSTSPSIGGSPSIAVKVSGANLAVVAAPSQAVSPFTSLEGAHAAVTSLERQVVELRTTVTQLLQLVQPLLTQQQAHMQQLPQHQAMLSTFGTPANMFGWMSQQQQLQQQHVPSSSTTGMLFSGMQQGQLPQQASAQSLSNPAQQQVPYQQQPQHAGQTHYQQQYLSHQQQQHANEGSAGQTQQQHGPSPGPVGNSLTAVAPSGQQQQQQQPEPIVNGSESGGTVGPGSGMQSIYGHWLKQR